MNNKNDKNDVIYTTLIHKTLFDVLDFERKFKDQHKELFYSTSLFEIFKDSVYWELYWELHVKN